MSMKPNRITIHCTDSPNGKPFTIDQIRKVHMEQFGWNDVGYHLVIQPDGKSETGRKLTEKGAGVAGANTDNVHICLVGKDAFMPEQFKTLRRHVELLQSCYSIDHHRIFCHYEFQSAGGTIPVAQTKVRQHKSCPNIRASDLVLWLYCNDWRVLKPYLLIGGK